MLQIQSPSDRPSSPHPILNLAFRIFFSAGAIFAMLTMAIWILIYMGKTNIDVIQINPFYWHAHEMLFGYALAIIAGFLLTAVKTWTGVMMPYGYRLLGIFSGWAIARLSWMMVGFGVFNTKWWIIIAAISDMVFVIWTSWVIIKAVMSVKQYKQMGILSKLVLLTIANILCYWGILKGNMDHTHIGIYLGLYLIIGVVLTIGRRVIPFFIERGIAFGKADDGSQSFKPKNSVLLDRLSLLSFLIFMLTDLFFPDKYLITVSALSVFVINIIRLIGWYHQDIWGKPLLWSLYLGFLGLSASFILFAIQPWLGFSHSLAVHALAVPAIGLITVSMMSRVSLGHTGRSIHEPPKTVFAIFVLMSLVFVFRVVMPLLFIDYYLTWLMLAQSMWIACFLLFCISYIPILASPRTDKLFG